MAGGRLLILDDDPTVGQILLMSAQASGFEARLCLEVQPFLEALGPWMPTHLIAPKPRPTWPCASMAKHPACWPSRFAWPACANCSPTHAEPAQATRSGGSNAHFAGRL